MQPYVADLGVALVFGVGYYLFKQLHKDKTDSSYKEKIQTHLNKWSQAKTIQKFNSLIISNKDRNTDAFKILNSMQKAEINPDIVTYNCLLDMSLKLEQYEQAKKLFEEISDFTSPVQPDVVTFNILLKGCVSELREMTSLVGNASNKHEKGKIVSKVIQLFTDMTTRGVPKNEITFNTAIDGCVEGEDFDKAWNLYQEMAKYQIVKPDIYTYATLIKGLKANACNDNEINLERAVEILNKIKSGEYENLKADEVLYNSVLDTCVKYSKIDLAESIFEEMTSQAVSPSLITYSIMIKGYGMVYKLDKAVQTFNDLKNIGFEPNEIIYGCLLNAAVRCNRIDIMNEIYQNMKKDGIKPNSIIHTTLIKGYNKIKKYDLAFEIFDSIPEIEKDSSNIVIYNAILDCCVESKNFEKLNDIYLYIRTKSEKLENFPQPNVITYSTVIKGFAKSGRVEEANRIYEFLKSNAYQLDEVLFNTVCDGFARANQNALAHKILSDMKAAGVKRSSIIYSILIKMYSNQMDEIGSLKVYEEMIKDGVKPSLVTYTTLMQMFIKKKKLLKACEIFEDMKADNIKPDPVCYNFIVNGCTFNQKLELAIKYLLESINENMKLSEETYNNCLEYLLNNKFMKYPDRCSNAQNILKALKEKNFSIKYDLYSRLMRLIYNNYENKREVEGNLKMNFQNFTNLTEKSECPNSFTKSKDGLNKIRKHNHKY